MSARKKMSLSVLVLWSTAAAMIFVLLLLLLCALLISCQIVSKDASVGLAAAAAGVGPMLSIMIFGRQSKIPAALGGIVLATYLAVCLLIGLILCGAEIFSVAMLYRSAAAVVGVLIGIMVSLKNRKRRKSRKSLH